MAAATVERLIEDTARALDSAGLVFGHGTDNAWDEATALVLGVTELADDRASLAVAVTPATAQRIRALARRRIEERLPLPYLLGRVRFAGYEFLIEPGVVIPRSPIGELIEQRFRPWLGHAPERILDLCTGSGCIGIAAAHVFPEATVTLIDVAPAAVVLARSNADRHGLANRVTVLEGNLFAPLPAESTFDLVLSNPPYVDREDMSCLPAEFRHEPERGLAGGDDGLDIVRRILEDAPGHMTSSGTLICEVGMSAGALSRAFPQRSFIWPEFERGGEGVFILPAA